MILTAALQSCLRHTSVSNVARLSGEQGVQALRALNDAVQGWFAIAPPCYRQFSVSHRIRPVRTLTITVTDESPDVDGTPFEAYELYQSIAIANADMILANQIAGTSSLVHDYRGTTGETTATIYYDAMVLSDYSVARVIGDPILMDTNAALGRWQRDAPNHRFDRSTWYADWSRERWMAQINEYPTSWDIEPYGISRSVAGDAKMGVRFYPLPTNESTIKLKLDVRPRVYTLLDLVDDSVTLPLDDELATLTLLPLIEDKLSLSSFFTGGDKVAKRLADEAVTARALVRALPNELGRIAMKVGTRPGY